MKNVLELILIRHTKWDKKNDKPLTTFEKEVKNILSKLKNEKFDIVYSSPAKRCLILASKISKEFKKPLRVSKLLRERDEGIFKNIPNHEKLMKKEAKKLGLHYVEFRLKNGESVLDVLERTKKFLKRLKERKVVIVTHYTNILCFYSLAKRIDIRKVWDENLIDPNYGEVIKLYFRKVF